MLGELVLVFVVRGEHSGLGLVIQVVLKLACGRRSILLVGADDRAGARLLSRQLVLVHLGHERLGYVFPGRQIRSRVIHDYLSCSSTLDLEGIRRLSMDLPDA